MKPFFVAKPSNQTILADQTAEFACRVGGDPPPEILWRRNDGKKPIGGANILEDKSLRIERVTPQDQGIYICYAENDVGAISASATLIVHCKYSPFDNPSINFCQTNRHRDKFHKETTIHLMNFTARPVFTNFPKDEIVNVGSDATFSCSAKGAPKPSIFWSREGSQELMFPGNTYQDRFTVSEDGTLKIKNTIRKDEGHYVCNAISQAGASKETVFLQVICQFFFLVKNSIF